jgi:peptide/nickel transport system substrate-binding protein
MGGYWDKIEGNAAEVVFTPIGNDATRVAALLSGEVDVMEPVPVQDIARVNASGSVRAVTGPELRTIFLGMDQKRDELLYSNVKGKNPFKDKRVRQAFYQAIDIDGIKRVVMRGASNPTALMVGPGINGFSTDQNKRLPHDVEAAKKLLAEAGYPSGFEVALNCPNDRYVNDRLICETVAANLSRIGVKINLQAETKGTYFPKILRRDTSFYMLGWTPGTYDAHNALNALMRCVDDKGSGQFNLGAYCNPKVDELTLKIQSETDKDKRNAMIREAFDLHSGRHRPPAPAPAGPGLGGEQQGQAGATGRQLHALQVDERAVSRRPLSSFPTDPRPEAAHHHHPGGAWPSDTDFPQ